MKNKITYMLGIIFAFACIQLTFAQSNYKAVEDLIALSTLVFEDDFNRKEKDDTLEDLGRGWKTNSVNRAEGHKQADLRDNVLFVEMYEHATHGTSILHTAPFDDGIVRIKFRMLSVSEKGKGVEFNFNDPNAKDLAHNGHVCQVAVNLSGVKIGDQFTGVFQKDIYLKRKSNAPKEEIQQLLKGKSKKVNLKLELSKWYEITMFFQKDVLSVYLDNKFVGKHKSEGFDHKVKDNLALAQWSSSAEYDDLQIWSLD